MTGYIYRKPSGFVNLEGHHSGPSLSDHSSAILMQYGSRRDHSNLNHSETPQNSQNLTVRGLLSRVFRRKEGDDLFHNKFHAAIDYKFAF